MIYKVRQFIFGLIIFVLFASSVIAQDSSNYKDRRWGIPEKPENCETNAVLMEWVTALMREELNPNGVIILIARLGKGETDRELNRRRLFNITERYKVNLGLPTDKIVAAQGEKVDDFGRIEIYWNGELIGGLPVSNNKDICVSCCPPNENHYPDRDAFERKQKRRIKKGS